MIWISFFGSNCGVECLFKFKIDNMIYPSGFDGVHAVSVGGSLGGRLMQSRERLCLDDLIRLLGQQRFRPVQLYAHD